MAFSNEEHEQITKDDLAAWQRARALDAAAQDALRAALGEEALAKRMPRATLPFPRRRALAQVAAETRNAEAQRLLAESSAIWWGFADRHARLIQSTAKRYLWSDNDDLVSVLKEATMRAAVDWDPARGCFSTVWAKVARTLWQRAPERQSIVSRGSRSWRTASYEPILPATEAAPAAVVFPDEGWQDRIRAMDALDQLPPEDADIVRRVVLHEESIVAVAKALGLPRARVADQLHAALAQLRRGLKVEPVRRAAAAPRPVATLPTLMIAVPG